MMPWYDTLFLATNVSVLAMIVPMVIWRDHFCAKQAAFGGAIMMVVSLTSLVAHACRAFS